MAWNDRPYGWLLRRGVSEDFQPFRFVDDGGPVDLSTSVLHLYVRWGGTDQLHLVSGVDPLVQILDQAPDGLTVGMAQAAFTAEQMDLMPADGISFAWWRQVGEDDPVPEFSGQIAFEATPGDGHAQ